MRLELLGLVSYNLWRLNKAEHIREDVKYLMGRADVDVICFQESAGWYGLVLDLVNESRGAWKMADAGRIPRGAKQNIVLWKTKTFEATKVRFIDLPESRKGVPDRWLTRVRLRIQGSDRQLVILATHMHSHVQNPSWWWLPRQLDYRKHVKIVQWLAEHAHKDRGVLAVADWNVDMHSRVASRVPFFPKAMLRKAKMRSNWDALGYKGFSGTHGARFIDAAFLRTCPWLRFRSQQVIKLSSDHKALLVRLQVTHATP